LIGGKGNVELAHLSSLKNFDRIKCPSVGEIVRLHASCQRVGVADSAGNLAVHVFDSKFLNPCVFQLKKAGVVDFSFMRPSVMAVLSNTAVNVYDTLLHPKRQLKFKQPFTKDPISVTAIDETLLAVLRKNEVLIYDIRMEKLESSKELKGKGKSMLVQGKNIFVGQSDCRVRVFSIVGEESDIIKLGVLGNYYGIQMKRTAIEWQWRRFTPTKTSCWLPPAKAPSSTFPNSPSDVYNIHLNMKKGTKDESKPKGKSSSLTAKNYAFPNVSNENCIRIAVKLLGVSDETY
jgi:hypothetical protein